MLQIFRKRKYDFDVKCLLNIKKLLIRHEDESNASNEKHELRSTLNVF